MHVIVDGVDAEAAVFVGSIFQKQATDIAVLKVDMLDGGGPAVLGDFVDHPQTVHQILHKGKFHLTGARVHHVEIAIGNDVHITLGEKVTAFRPT